MTVRHYCQGLGDCHLIRFRKTDNSDFFMLIDCGIHSSVKGGSKKIEKQHKDGKWTARERIARLIDDASQFLEIGLLLGYDRHNGQAPAAGVVTGLARIEGRPAVLVVNDATVKAAGRMKPFIGPPPEVDYCVR